MKNLHHIFFTALLILATASFSYAQKSNGNSGNNSGNVGCNVFIPDAFTPNGDNINDRFEIKYSDVCDVTSYHLMVFDRWGRLVYEAKSANPDLAWDGKFEGKEMQGGVYIWNLQMTINPSYVGEQDHINRHGTVVVLR